MTVFHMVEEMTFGLVSHGRRSSQLHSSLLSRRSRLYGNGLGRSFESLGLVVIGGTPNTLNRG